MAFRVFTEGCGFVESSNGEDSFDDESSDDKIDWGRRHTDCWWNSL